ncbi:PEPxxWA-CTERM sorting domain-containing protein [Phenylobacterium sp.]|uniref:PEPxxWA-CTERM sorting domain-containing protein n=1 Tax=Phenylobacterium sp. TaxID=1871053 RepID=UPI002C609E87|nr:PEPxxWA-CTERM sorting domain-containing protein [Phenylobacterium sp.]HLZ75712.1 PEPxxWA-CTERM sorting domain-containing protein [Phenylobacterium sp.]
MSGLGKFAAGAVAALAISGGAAQASTWVIDYTANNLGDTPFSATVDLVASDTLNTVNGFNVLSVSGNVDGDAITGLVNNPNQPTVSTSPDGLFYFDNVVWPGAAEQLSNPGILFTGASGTEYNLFSDDPVHYELYTAMNGSWGAHSYGTIAMAQTFTQGGFDRDSLGVPEPASWALMILGFGAVGAVLRRRHHGALASA